MGRHIKEMFSFFKASAVLMLALVIFPQYSVSQDLPHLTMDQTGETTRSAVGIPPVDDNLHDRTTKANSGPADDREALRFRRRAYYYSWRGGCYTQDRNQNWYQVDSRLC